MALAANGDVLARGDIAEIDGEPNGSFAVSLARSRSEHMILRRAVAHFTVDSTFAKFEVPPA